MPHPVRGLIQRKLAVALAQLWLSDNFPNGITKGGRADFVIYGADLLGGEECIGGRRIRVTVKLEKNADPESEDS